MGMGSSRGNNSRGLVADINVTPLVDVMLVLLIIFMVTAPMMTQGLNVDLPETTANEVRQKEDPQVVSIDEKGKIMLGKIEYTQALLRDQLAKLYKEKGKEELILLKADKKVPYGLVASVMADIKTAGFTKLGMVTKLPEEKK
jgi:biopolymer transport protein TolR